MELNMGCSNPALMMPNDYALRNRMRRTIPASHIKKNQKQKQRDPTLNCSFSPPETGLAMSRGTLEAIC